MKINLHYERQGAYHDMAKSKLDQHPLTATLDELVKHETYISQSEAADVKAKELGCVSRA